MAKPTTKSELILAGDKQFTKFWEILDSMSEQGRDIEFHFGSDAGKEAHWQRDKNVRDVFVHLYEWHELLLNWAGANRGGDEQSFLPEPYNWRTYGDMNVEFWKKHQDTSYDQARKMLKDSHEKVIKLIEVFSDDELFSRGRFSWVGGSTLGQYCTSVTSSHYDWAIKKLKAYMKIL
ncbi:ClbS/DfsB family four-helix bundle protein [Candidatus Saccharibacteria bacterium]|nr:ClbS/DfsB family four-helix bundle protein [Candidatus Saccharibacteria bacterium]